MNLRTSILANYLSHFYVSLISMALVPTYLRLMGAEAYGLVSFYSILFSLFYLLDMGLTPTISRETARFHGGVISAQEFRLLFRALSVAFALIAVIGALGIWFANDWLVGRWFNLDTVSLPTAKMAVTLMAFSVSMRWMGGLSRGVLSGGEHMVWLPAFNATITTLRFVGVLLVMRVWGYNVEVFFIYQLGVAVLEFFWLIAKVQSLLPAVKVVGWSFVPLRPLLQFGLTTALSSALSVLLMQVDKFLLSGLLPLAEYGHFSLAVVVATSVMVVSAPISNVLMPRMVRLHAENREAELQSVYRLSTRMTSSFALGGAMTLAFCAHPLLITWTGDAEWAHRYWPVLALYALGYGFWALGAFPYYLQYARGQMRWHLIGNVLFFILQVPSVIFAVNYFGVVGAGFVWLTFSGLYLIVWGSVVHRFLSSMSHAKWLFNDVLRMNWPVIFGMCFVSLINIQIETRRESFSYVAVVGGFLMLLNIAWLVWNERKIWKNWHILNASEK